METSNIEQQTTPKAEPQKEHEWLQRLVGDWTFEGEATMEPGKPAQKFAGTETVRPLGGFWILAEGGGDFPCEDGRREKATTLMTLGYDTEKKRYVGTFIGSMMTFMFLYEGSLDTAGKVLALDTEGPSFSVPGQTAKYRDVIEVKSNDHRVLSSSALGEDGKWHQFMTMHHRRRK
jgi:hypothetical protein